MAKYWIGQDGNVWVANADGSASNAGKPVKKVAGGIEAQRMSIAGEEIEDPVAPTGGGDNTGGGGAAVDPEEAQAAALRDKIMGRAGDIDNVYGSLFSDLEKLIKSRDAELESQYGDQLKTASKNYTDAIPQIDASYAAVGAYDSTNRGDARTKADEGFKSTTKTIGDNKNKDKAALGQYSNEQRCFQPDQLSGQVESATCPTPVERQLELGFHLF